MDIRSIVRVFRFNELASKAERDPEAKRPPTVKFIGLALALGLLLVGISFWNAPQTDVSGTVPLAIESTDPVPTNETSDAAPTAQVGPGSEASVAEGDYAARPRP